MFVTATLTVALLLVAPDMVSIALRLLPEWGGRTRLGRRQLTGDTPRVVAAVSILAILIGASTGYIALLDTLIRTAQSQSYPDVLPGQLVVGDVGNVLAPPSSQVVDTVEQSGIVTASSAVRIGQAVAVDPSGEVRRSVTRDGSDRTFIVLGSTAEVERLLGVRLTARQEATLRGGFLVWRDSVTVDHDRPEGTALVQRDGDTVVSRTRPLDTSPVDAPLVRWRVGTDGVLLGATARSLGMPVARGPVLYTGLSPAQAHAVQAAVISAGLDARGVLVYAAPPPAIPPTALVVTAIGVLLLVLIVSVATTRGQARSLRGYLAQLVAIGLAPRWAREVFLYQHVVVVAISTVLGLVIGIPPVLLISMRVSGFVLSLPWAAIGMLLLTIYITTTMAALGAMRGLSVRERTST